MPSCAVVTTVSAPIMARLHDRMPVLLPEDAWSLWLDPEEHSRDVLEEFLVPADGDELELFPVSTRVNSVRNEGPDLIAEVPLAAPPVLWS